ncbi:MAG: PAS domain S-box protein [Bacteroidota bacterium]
MIEDSLGDARLISEMIRESRDESIKLEHTVRLSKGLERLSQEGVDLVLLDLGLPDSIGLDTLSKVREAFPDVPVICLTGLEDEYLGYQAVQMGAQDYLIKIQVEPNLLYRSIIYAIERKKKDIILSESEERFQSTFEFAAVGIAHIDLEGKWMRVNHKLCEILGYSHDELLEQKFADTVFSEDRDAYYSAVRKLMSGNTESFVTECHSNRKNGSSIWLSLTISLIRLRNDEPAYLIATISDITHHKSAENYHKPQTPRSSYILEELPLAFLIVSADNHLVIESNRLFESLCGYEKPQLCGKNVAELDLFPGTDLQSLSKIYQKDHRLQDSGAAPHSGTAVELRVNTRDNYVKTFRSFISRSRYESENFITIVLIEEIKQNIPNDNSMAGKYMH